MCLRSKYAIINKVRIGTICILAACCPFIIGWPSVNFGVNDDTLKSLQEDIILIQKAIITLGDQIEIYVTAHVKGEPEKIIGPSKTSTRILKSDFTNTIAYNKQGYKTLSYFYFNVGQVDLKIERQIQYLTEVEAALAKWKKNFAEQPASKN